MYGMKTKPSLRILRYAFLRTHLCIYPRVHRHPAAPNWVLARGCCVCTDRRPQFEQTKESENQAAEQKTARAPRTFGFPGAADHVTMNLHGIDDGRSVEDVSSSTRWQMLTNTTSLHVTTCTHDQSHDCAQLGLSSGKQDAHQLALALAV